MTYAYCGLMGGGKTILAVRTMLERMANGGIVYTNIILNEKECLDYIKLRFGKVVNWAKCYRLLPSEDMDNVLHTIKIPPSGQPATMICIDECTEYFDTSDRDTVQARMYHKTWGAFLRHSRKVNIDTYLITQVFETINPKLRKFVQFVVTTRDCQNFKLGFWELGKQIPYFRNRFRQTYWNVETKAEAGSPKMWVKDTLLYSCYDTRQICGKNMLVSETDNKTEVSNVPKKKLNPVFLVGFSIVLSIFGAGYLFGSRGRSEIIRGVPNSVTITNYVNGGVPLYLKAPVSFPTIVTNIVEISLPKWSVGIWDGGSCMRFDDGTEWQLGSWDTPYGLLYNIGRNVSWCVTYGQTNVTHYCLKYSMEKSIPSMVESK